MFKNLFICTSLFMLSLSVVSGQAVYIVNSNNDMDDGTCDAMHCSLREAIKASEADGKYSIINFNIGPGTQVIVPAGPLPVINADSTDIGIPAGNPNKVTINFSYRDFGGASFLQINGSHTNIFGLEFTNMLYNSNNDHIIRLGVQPIILSSPVSRDVHSTMITLPYRAQIANLSMWHNPIR